MGAREGKSEGVQNGEIQRDRVDFSEETRIGCTGGFRMGHLKGLAAGGGPVGTLNAVREWSSWLQVGSC